jgi:hypothetical protein
MTHLRSLGKFSVPLMVRGVKIERHIHREAHWTTAHRHDTRGRNAITIHEKIQKRNAESRA